MKTVKILVLTVITLFVISALPEHTNAGPRVRIYTGVPVVRTIKPGPKYVWVPGHYKLNKYGKKVWVPGHWKRV